MRSPDGTRLALGRRGVVLRSHLPSRRYAHAPRRVSARRGRPAGLTAGVGEGTPSCRPRRRSPRPTSSPRRTAGPCPTSSGRSSTSCCAASTRRSWSGAVGLHFASPSNRLWPTLHASGWTPRRLLPLGDRRRAGRRPRHHQPRPPCDGPGRRARRRRAPRRGSPASASSPSGCSPRFVAFLGLSSYRVATGERRAAVGPQERRVGGAPVLAAAEPERPERLVAAARAWPRPTARCARPRAVRRR